jgi:hypothetical protein
MSQDDATHSPGPWKVVRPRHGHATKCLCVQIGNDETYTTVEVKPADARLIAAAPDLLAERDAALARETRLAEALRPFAEYAGRLNGWPDETSTCVLFAQADGTLQQKPTVDLGHCRRAAAALAEYDGARPAKEEQDHA